MVWFGVGLGLEAEVEVGLGFEAETVTGLDWLWKLAGLWNWK